MSRVLVDFALLLAVVAVIALLSAYGASVVALVGVR